MSKYMVRVYFKYQIFRFTDYIAREKGSFVKDVASAKLGSMIAFVFGLFMVFAYVLNSNWYYSLAGIVFIMYGFITYTYRDYRRGIHIGWYRKRLKELSNNG